MAKRVIIESPYSGDIEKNVEYALLCMQDSLLKGEAPFLSHLLYTQHPTLSFVSDSDEKNQCVGRDAAMNAAMSWTEVSDLVAVYTDRGISSGMRYGIDRALKMNKVIEYRSLNLPENS